MQRHYCLAATLLLGRLALHRDINTQFVLRSFKLQIDCSACGANHQRLQLKWSEGSARRAVAANDQIPRKNQPTTSCWSVRLHRLDDQSELTECYECRIWECIDARTSDFTAEIPIPHMWGVDIFRINQQHMSATWIHMPAIFAAAPRVYHADAETYRHKRGRSHRHARPPLEHTRGDTER